MWQSLKEHAVAVTRWWWVVGMGGTIATAGAVQDVSGGLDVPVWVWVLLGFAGLSAAQFLAFHEIRSQVGEKAQRREIRAVLGQMLSEGQELSRRCRNERDPPPEQEANDWAARTEEYLAEHLGSDYVASFGSGAGLPTGFTTISSMEHRNLDSGIRVRLARLEQFLAELRG